MSSKSARPALCAAIILFALVAVALMPGGASAAGHGHHGKTKHRPAGAVKLPKSKIHHVKGVVCGELHRKWVPGSIVGGYFISDSQQAHNYSVLAKHAKGKSKAADTKFAKKFGKRAKARQKVCAKAGRGSGKNKGTGSGKGEVGKPLHFNLDGAIGVALKGSSTGGATTGMRRPIGATASVAPEASGSNLVTINGAGEVSDAVSSGSAAISRFLIAPNEQLYVIFEHPVNLSNTSEPAQPGSGCILAQVDPRSGNPACIDSSLESVGGSGVTISGLGPINPPIQFDSSGAIYYQGRTTSGETVLRKWSNGTSTNLIPPAHVLLREFLVLPDGTVLLSGITSATQAQWTRRISPSGSLKTLAGGMASFIARFPDGNSYMGFDSTIAGMGIDSYEESADELGSKWWLAHSEGPTAPGGGEFNSYETLCAPSAHPTSAVQQGFCGGEAVIAGNFATGEGKDFVVSGFGEPKVAMEFYPTISVLPTMVTNVTVAQAVANDLLLAGASSSGSQVLTLFDTSTEQETQLLGPPLTSDEYEIYHLNYVANGNKILFDGLRFSDNQYVIGEYDLSTHTLNVVATSTNKWSDVQSF